MKIRKCLLAIGICLGLGLWLEQPVEIGQESQGHYSPSNVSQAIGPSPPNVQAVSAETTPASPQPGSPLPSVLPNVLAESSGPDLIREPAFVAFREWIDRYVRSPGGAEQERLLNEGLSLARQRRDDLEDMIQSDPRRALEMAMPYRLRRMVPVEVERLLERWVDGRGRLEVMAALPATDQETVAKPVFRVAQIGGAEYRAFVYGRRLGEPTRTDIPIHGIALDNLLAVSERTLRVMEPGEVVALPEAGPVMACASCGAPLASARTPPRVVAGQEVLAVCDVEHAERLDQGRMTEEIARGPGDEESGRVHAASAWTQGEKTLILVRVDFADLAGEPFAGATGVNLISNVNRFYQECSYGKAGFRLSGEGSEITPTFRMPQTASYYGTNDFYSQLRKDARAAATEAGYDLSQYQFDLICFGEVPGWDWAGLGYVGAAGVWLRDSFGTGVAAHELGHNFGLNHANFWDTGGESVIGPGASVEYGDKFDTMGSAGAGAKHFNARYKNYLNWLANTNVVTFTTNGFYEIQPQDLTNDLGLRAFKIPRNDRTNYWVEFRQKYTSNKWLMNGISVRWARSGNQSTLLLDTTAGSLDGKDDAAVVWGQTFMDPVAQIFITAWGPTQTVPPAARIYVHRGLSPGNHPPMLQLTAPAMAAAVNQPFELIAQAVDADGDPLVYAWDFGDRNLGTNQAAATHAWGSAGQYLVRCVASDMRGGTASASVVVQVGQSSTFVLSGYVTAEGTPLANVRVQVSSALSTLSDSDGSFKLPNVSRGAYTLTAKLGGYMFLHPGFDNPVSVTTNLTDLDWLGVPLAGQQTLSLVTAGARWKYHDEGADLGTPWRQPEYDDGSWREGVAQLGYGDNDVATRIGFGPDSGNKYLTTYFRHRFVVSHPSELTAFTLGVLRDDGAVVYLNGKEVFRSNMPKGSLNYQTLASAVTGGADESTFFETELNAADFLAGTNVLAVEVHQANSSSSDLGFDLRLQASPVAQFVEPTLYWERMTDGLRLHWPSALTGWELISRSTLDDGWAWMKPEAEPIETNGLKVLYLPLNSPDQFFQLRQNAR